MPITTKSSDSVNQSETLSKNASSENKYPLPGSFQFRKLIENSYEGISLFDRELNLIYRSPSAVRITGWETSDRIERDFEGLVHPEDELEVNTLLKDLAERPGSSRNCTFRSRHLSGHYIWLECVFTNMLDLVDVQSIVCNFRDITDRKHSEKLLQKTVQELCAYKYALDESSIVAITDQKGIILYVNDNFCRISKYTAAELIGQDHRIINSSFHDKSYIRNLWVTIANGKTWKGEFKNMAKDGSYYWVDTTIVPFLNDAGKPYKYISVRSDITKRKLSEIELKELNEHLEIQTKELAISNAELEQFAYVASHDLQEPLRMVTSFLTQIEKKYDQILDDKGRQYIHFAVDGAKRMRQIILDLLDFSKIGRTTDSLESVDLNTLVDDIINLFHKQIEELHADVRHQQLPALKTSRAPIRQVFQNLIGNSLKYHHRDRKPEIVISCRDLGKYWEFCVKDNGIGIDAEYFDKIFIIFQRLHNKTEYSGTGMGLAITKKIVENMGGEIWLSSAESMGSSFYFTILKT